MGRHSAATGNFEAAAAGGPAVAARVRVARPAGLAPVVQRLSPWRWRRSAAAAVAGGIAAAALPLLHADRIDVANPLAVSAGGAEAVAELARSAGQQQLRGAVPAASAAPAVPIVAGVLPMPSSATAVTDLPASRKATAAERARSPSARVELSSSAGSPVRVRTVSGPGFVRPVTGRITSNYGPRWGTTHYGLDIANRIGTPIRSVGAGTVISAGPASGFGLWVRVRLNDGTTTVYGHINKALVRVGQRVDAGDVIAELGNRGKSTGPHLHFETIAADGRRVDPLTWLERRGAGRVVD